MSDVITSPAPAEADSKLIANLRARAALAGFELEHLLDGSFVVSRWGMSRALDHPAAVERFLDRVGGRSG